MGNPLAIGVGALVFGASYATTAFLVGPAMHEDSSQHADTSPNAIRAATFIPVAGPVVATAMLVGEDHQSGLVHLDGLWYVFTIPLTIAQGVGVGAMVFGILDRQNVPVSAARRATPKIATHVAPWALPGGGGALFTVAGF